MRTLLTHDEKMYITRSIDIDRESRCNLVRNVGTEIHTHNMSWSLFSAVLVHISIHLDVLMYCTCAVNVHILLYRSTQL